MKPEDQFSVPLPCGRYKQNISDSRTSGSSPSGTPQNGSGQFISEYVAYVVVLVFLVIVVVSVVIVIILSLVEIGSVIDEIYLLLLLFCCC